MPYKLPSKAADRSVRSYTAFPCGAWIELAALVARLKAVPFPQILVGRSAHHWIPLRTTGPVRASIHYSLQSFASLDGSETRLSMISCAAPSASADSRVNMGGAFCL
jgi:hypothetical protein